MNRSLLLAARRMRLLAILAGLAWLMGIHPSLWVRMLLVASVAVTLIVDALADAGLHPGPVRLTGWGRPGGEDR